MKKTTNTKTSEAQSSTVRPPVVVVMGHIDHGKSTLLSYIRKSNKPLNEAGGITQHISAYEVEHTNSEGKKSKMTFLDTPGHEAFGGIRKRGARVSDVAVLVVSAEDGVKPQTIEALNSIKESGTPFIVAINKIDKEGADIDRTKNSLVENEIYVEGYGGDIPCVPISAKTGEGVPLLLDMISLVAELQELKGDANKKAVGVVIESNRDIKKGISATCIIKDGSLRKGMFIVSGKASSPIRIMEDYTGKAIDSATFSSPVKIIGWDELPSIGCEFEVFETRDEARNKIAELKESNSKPNTNGAEESTDIFCVPFVVKADTGSSLEAVLSEIKKTATDRVRAKVISSGIGSVCESDIRLADGSEKAIVIGFNVNIDSPAKHLAERSEIEIQTFEIIYKMNEWLKDILQSKTPKVMTQEVSGRAKVLKVFSKVRDRQIIGARVEKGEITLGADVKIIRRESEIGVGKIRELQKQKNEAREVSEGQECGAMIVCNTEIAPGDYFEAFTLVEK